MADEVGVVLDAGVALDGTMAGAVDGGEDGVVVHVGVGLAMPEAGARGFDDWVPVVVGGGPDSSEGSGVADLDAGGVNEGSAAGEEVLVANTDAVEEDWVPGTFEVGPVGAKGNGVADEYAGGVSEYCNAVGYVLIANT